MRLGNWPHTSEGSYRQACSPLHRPFTLPPQFMMVGASDLAIFKRQVIARAQSAVLIRWAAKQHGERGNR